MKLDAIDVLAVHRLAVLAIDDAIIEAPRDRLIDWLERSEHWKLSQLLQCYWCLGWWISVGAVLFARRWPRAWALARAPLALSSSVGLIAELHRAVRQAHSVLSEIEDLS